MDSGWTHAIQPAKIISFFNASTKTEKGTAFSGVKVLPSKKLWNSFPAKTPLDAISKAALTHKIGRIPPKAFPPKVEKILFFWVFAHKGLYNNPLPS